MTFARRLWPNTLPDYVPNLPKLLHYALERARRAAGQVIEQAASGPLGTSGRCGDRDAALDQSRPLPRDGRAQCWFVRGFRS